MLALVLLGLAPLPAAAAPTAQIDDNDHGPKGRQHWGISLSIPTAIINSFGVFSGAGERLPEAAPGPYSEVGFGALLEAHVDGVGVIRGLWRPGAVLFSGYADDPQRVSDPWSDVLLEIGAPVVGPERSLWRVRDLAVTAGPRVTIPAATVDYEAQSRLQSRKDVYIGSNQDLHAWSLGLFADGMWPLLWPGPIREDTAWRRRLGVTAGLRWDRFLPMDYPESGLDAYRLNALRELLKGREPYQRIDYRSRYRIDVTARSSWEHGDVDLSADAGFGGWWRASPRVDDLRPIAGTGAGRVDLQAALELRVALGQYLHIGLSSDGVVPLFGRNVAVESIFAFNVDLGIGAYSDGFVSPPLKQ